MKKYVLPVLLFIALRLAAQDGGGKEGTPIPQPSIDRENALARFGIVTLGSFPLMLLYSDLSFDIGRYFANGCAPEYAPWPFKSEYSAEVSEEEKLLRIGAAACASIAVGTIDFLIRQAKAKKERLRREALLEYSAEQKASREENEGMQSRREFDPTP
jgi:hypothetical protein